MDKKSRELVMAKLYFKNKDYKMAEKSFNEYLSMNPEDVAASKLLAQVYEQNKRFDKAFEMYERCYLAEPDRTGVLLDICRILLMNEIWLEHVDYRKWLNLAIKAFPSNPIVVNFKAFLSTLPPDDQTSPQSERVISTKATKSLTEDPLTKILDKLLTMEKRLESIEDKIGNLTISQIATTSSSQSTQVSTPTQAPAPVSKPNPPVSKPITPLSKPSPPISKPITPLSKPSPPISKPSPPISKPSPPISEPFPPVNKPSPPTYVSTQATTNLFALGKPDLSSETNSFCQPLNLNTGAFSFSMQSTANETKPNPSPVNLSTNLFSESTKNQSLFKPSLTFGAGMKSFTLTTPTTTSTTTDTNTFSSSADLFANSISKFNIAPTWSTTANSSFSFSKPQENKDDDQDDSKSEEFVQNVELPIENTCDMEPIEIKTGEEDEDIIFEHRCKLFRFKDKEYKERGLGSIKVLKHKITSKGRLIMRREAIGLVCLNCWDCSKIVRASDTQVRWLGMDASDEVPAPTLFLVKFKTKELTDTFMSHMTSLFSEESSSTNTSLIASPPSKADNVKSSSNANPAEKPDVELIDPKLDQSLVDKARQFQLPDLFYHKLKNQEPCGGCNGCEKDD